MFWNPIISLFSLKIWEKLSTAEGDKNVPSPEPATGSPKSQPSDIPTDQKKLLQKGAFRIPRIFRPENENGVLDPILYSSLLVGLIDAVKSRTEDTLEGRVLGVILEERRLDDELFNKLLKDIYYAYNLDPAEGTSYMDSITELRAHLSDDAQFVDLALKFSDAFSLPPSDSALIIFTKLSVPSRQDLKLIRPLLARGGGTLPILEYLQGADPTLYEQLALESPEFFKSLCGYQAMFVLNNNKPLITKELAEKVIRRFPELYRYLPKELKTIETLEPPWCDEVAAEKKMIRALSSKDKENSIELLRAYPSLYRKTKDPNFLANPKMMEIAALQKENFPLILKQANVPRSLVLEAVEIDGRLLRYVTREEFLKDPEIITRALQRDATAIYAVHPSQRYSRKWYPLLRKDPRTRHLTELPHGLSFPERFAKANYEQMSRDREDLEARIEKNPIKPDHPERPVALYIYPISDHNGAFATNQIGKMQEAGFQVVYYEVSSEEEYIRVLRNYLPLLREQDVVVTGGHGTRSALNFAAKDPYIEGVVQREERYFLDWEDEKELKAAFPEEMIHSGVTLIHESCSNAEGGAEKSNLMNMSYRVFRAKWHVYAGDKPDPFKLEIENQKVKLRGQKNAQVYHRPPENAPVEVEDPDSLIYSLKKSVRFFLGYFSGSGSNEDPKVI